MDALELPEGYEEERLEDYAGAPCFVGQAFEVVDDAKAKEDAEKEAARKERCKPSNKAWTVAIHTFEKQKTDLLELERFVTYLKVNEVDIPECWFCHPQLISRLARLYAWDRELVYGEPAGAGKPSFEWWDFGVDHLMTAIAASGGKLGPHPHHQAKGTSSAELSKRIRTPKSVTEFLETSEFATLFTPAAAMARPLDNGEGGAMSVASQHPVSEAESKFLAWVCILAAGAIPASAIASAVSGKISVPLILRGQSALPMGWFVTFLLAEAIVCSLAGYVWNGRKWDGILNAGDGRKDPTIARQVFPWTSPQMKARMNLPKYQLVMGITKKNRWLVTPERASALIIAPPQSGKTTGALLPNIAQHEGVVVSTSSKIEMAKLAAPWRTTKGLVYLYDPFNAVPFENEWIRIAYNPVMGAEKWDTAIATAAAMTEGRAAGVTNATHWESRAGQLLASLLHAAALTDTPLASTVSGWFGAYDFVTAQEILDQHGGHPAAQEMLRSMKKIPGSELGSIISNASSAMAAYSMAAVRDAEATGTKLDPDEFLTSGANTVFIVVPTNRAKVGAPLVLGFLDYLHEAVLRVSTINGGRLPIPIFYCLDEVANISPIDKGRLGQLLSESVGRNCSYYLCLQDYGQAESLWGSDFAKSLLTLCYAKAIMGGSSDVALLSAVTSLSGASEVEAHTASRSAEQLPKHLRQGDRIGATALAELKPNSVYVWQGTNPPMVVKAMPYYKVEPFRSWLKPGRRDLRIYGVKQGNDALQAESDSLPDKPDDKGGHQIAAIKRPLEVDDDASQISGNPQRGASRLVPYANRGGTTAKANAPRDVSGAVGQAKGVNRYDAICKECKKAVGVKQGIRRITALGWQVRHKACDYEAELRLEHLSEDRPLAAPTVSSPKPRIQAEAAEGKGY